MDQFYQRGAISLVGSAVLMAVIALAGVGALMSMRYERNLFAEAWSRLTTTVVAESVRQTKEAIKPQVTAIRKCMVDGKVVYSNVDCNGQNPTSRAVDLHDTRGVEAPKVAAPAASVEAGDEPDLRHKMIERAISQ